MYTFFYKKKLNDINTLILGVSKPLISLNIFFIFFEKSAFCGLTYFSIYGRMYIMENKEKYT